jgi:hypothetical protein
VRTDAPSFLEARYGFSIPMMTEVALNMSADTNTEVRIGPLKPGRLYYYAVIARDPEGARAMSEVRSFRAAGDSPPEVETFTLARVGKYDALFVWQSTTLVTAHLRYARLPDTTFLTQSTTSREPGGQITLKDLWPGSRYSCVLQIRDRLGTIAEAPAIELETQEENVALGKKVTGTFTNIPPDSFVERSVPALARVVDGKVNYVAGMCISGVVDEAEQWVEIDLGKEYRIARVHVVWRKLSYSRDYALFSRSARGKWETVSEHLNADGGQYVRGDRGDPCVRLTTDFGGRAARYVKLVVPKGSQRYVKHKEWPFVQIMEIVVVPVYEAAKKPRGR